MSVRGSARSPHPARTELLCREFWEGLHQLLRKGTGRRWKGRGKQLALAQRRNRVRGERPFLQRVPAALLISPCKRGCTKGVQLPIQNRTINKLHLVPVAGVFTKHCCYKQGCAPFQVTMADRAAAERACKDPNPIIDGRKANVNLAYLGAKPRSIQTGFTIGVQQLHPAFIQRPFGLTPHYVYPQAIIQPSVVIPTPVQSITSPYIDYTAASQAYSQYTTAAYDQYPYAASPAAGFVGYGYTGTVQPPLTAGTPAAPATAFVQYQPQQLQPDRMQ